MKVVKLKNFGSEVSRNFSKKMTKNGELYVQKFGYGESNPELPRALA